MPQQISAQQLYNLQHIVSGVIPLTARRMAGIDAWTDHYRRMSMGTTSLDRNSKFNLPQEGPDLNRKSLTFTPEYSKYNIGSDYRTSLPGDTSVKIDRQRLIINSFYNSMHEGMWEGAKALAEQYKDELPGLSKVYIEKYAEAHKNTLADKYYKNTEGRHKRAVADLVEQLRNLQKYGIVETELYQCVAFVKAYAKLVDSTFSSGLGKGSAAASNLVNASSKFNSLTYSRNTSIPSGSVMSVYGLAAGGGYTVNGHTFLVLNDLGDRIVVIEQAGELATSNEAYNGMNINKFNWGVGHDAYKPETGVPLNRYASYADRDSSGNLTGQHILTMMPRIRTISKDYLDLRKPTIAVPQSKVAQEAALEFLNNPVPRQRPQTAAELFRNAAQNNTTFLGGGQ